MNSPTFFMTLFIIANLFINGCHGGLLGFFAGTVVCQASCYAGYLACMGVATGTTGVLLPAVPAIVAACTAGETACLAACTTAFTVGTGPI
ncbi:unnamed protein product [Rotaria sp. Silwood2]|nr:unnamed protein product [Rotaria sp. Silwood2]CAF3040746.1 unnamed protein product [Rotaria sp. Silwood2]CAF3300411.1 unnamed protein product [Rotaria sp. Silwood2]CAF4080854.1 unnamed protein product [Rotaria sp. Silwood2]CAF4221340.1 unnamed protein product [Rotaria sp. Silwood2]